MATTYSYVAANRRKSAVLVIVFVVIVVLIGWVFVKLLDTGPIGLVIAVLFATITSLIGYYSGDRIALATAGAQGPIEKADNSYLYNMVENLCITVGLPTPKIYVIPDQQINAFATGRNPQNASIAVTQGAIERLENEELEGVLAHELSHVKNEDVRYMTLVAILVGLITLLSNYFWRASFWGGRRRSNNDSNQVQSILMIVGLVLLILAPIIGQLIQLAVSRKREFLADASGALITRYPEGLEHALEKIRDMTNEPLHTANQATAHLYFSNPFGPVARGMSKMFSTHPPIEERIDALRKIGGQR